MLTGGYGCIGSWIVKNLIEQGHEVSIYDIVENTDRMALIIGADDIEKVNFVDGDISDGIRLNKAIGDLGVSHLIHLAGLQVPVCRAYPIKGAMVNVIGTINVFEAAKKPCRHRQACGLREFSRRIRHGGRIWAGAHR